MRQIALRLLMAIVLFSFFGSIGCSLWVRQLIDKGALEKTTICLNARHYVLWKSGHIPQATMDDLLARQVRQKHLSGRRIRHSEWHFLGLIAHVGVKLSYGVDGRGKMAMQVIERMKRCPSEV